MQEIEFTALLFSKENSFIITQHTHTHTHTFKTDPGLTARVAWGDLPLVLMVLSVSWSRCENCVEMLFVRGSGNCVQCDTPLRKSNFRVQLFEDPGVDKEVEIRKKVLKMWVRGVSAVVGCGLLCFYMSSHVSSLFLSHLCLSHYIVCFVDNKLFPPQGWGGQTVRLFPCQVFTSQPLPAFSVFLLICSLIAP